MSTSKDLKNLAHATEETPEELEELKLWWERHGNIVTTILVALLVVVVGVRQWRSWRQSREQAAMDAMQNAVTADQLEEAAVSSKSAAVTALARLRLAGMRYESGEYELSLEAYEAFLRDSPNHPLVCVAKSGAAHALEALGRLDDAEEAYAAIAEDPTSSPFSADASLGQARVLVLKGTEESKARGKAMLDLFLAENAGTAWAGSADELLRAIDRLKMPERKDDVTAFLDAPAADADAPAEDGEKTDAPAATAEGGEKTEAPAADAEAPAEGGEKTDAPAAEADASAEGVETPAT